MRFGNFIRRNIRKLLFAMVPFVSMGMLSIIAFTEGDADKFEKIGAFITIWAVLNISIVRVYYSERIVKMEKRFVFEYFRYQKSREEFRDTSLAMTFDLHGCHIAQMSAAMGIPNPFCESTPSALKEFADDVESRLKDEGSFKDEQEENSRRFREFQSKYENEIGELRDWEKFSWKMEIFMIVWGTAQGAIGANAMDLFSKI